MHFYVTGYTCKFGMMVLVSLSFSRCVNFVKRGLVLVLNLLGLESCVLGLGLERFGLDNNTACNKVTFSSKYLLSTSLLLLANMSLPK